MLHAIGTLPGVEDVGLINHLPLGGHRINGGFEIEGRGEGSAGADYRVIGGDYLDAMGIPVLRGRGFDPSDDASVPDVAVINRTLAERYWPGEDAIGREFGTGFETDRPYRIIGIVEDYKVDTPGEAPKPYIPMVCAVPAMRRAR